MDANMDLDANQLNAAVRRKGQAALAQLVELSYERIYAFLRRLAGNDADAKDLTQRVFVRAGQSLPSFAGRSSVNSWIHSIAYHTYVDWRRANHRTESRSDEWWADCPSRDVPPDQAVADADLAVCLFASVDKLDPELRGAVHLHYYQGLTLQETADAMGVAASTIKYRLRQAISELQRNLGTNPRAKNRVPGPKFS